MASSLKRDVRVSINGTGKWEVKISTTKKNKMRALKLLDRSPLRATSEGESPLAQQRGRSGPERGTYNINKKGGHLLPPKHSNVTLRKVAAV